MHIHVGAMEKFLNCFIVYIVISHFEYGVLSRYTPGFETWKSFSQVEGENTVLNDQNSISNEHSVLEKKPSSKENQNFRDYSARTYLGSYRYRVHKHKIRPYSRRHLQSNYGTTTKPATNNHKRTMTTKAFNHHIKVLSNLKDFDVETYNYGYKIIVKPQIRHEIEIIPEVHGQIDSPLLKPGSDGNESDKKLDENYVSVKHKGIYSSMDFSNKPGTLNYLEYTKHSSTVDGKYTSESVLDETFLPKASEKYISQNVLDEKFQYATSEKYTSENILGENNPTESTSRKYTPENVLKEKFPPETTEKYTSENIRDEKLPSATVSTKYTTENFIDKKIPPGAAIEKYTSDSVLDESYETFLPETSEKYASETVPDETYETFTPISEKYTSETVLNEEFPSSTAHKEYTSENSLDVDFSLETVSEKEPSENVLDVKLTSETTEKRNASENEEDSENADEIVNTVNSTENYSEKSSDTAEFLLNENPFEIENKREDDFSGSNFIDAPDAIDKEINSFEGGSGDLDEFMEAGKFETTEISNRTPRTLDFFSTSNDSSECITPKGEPGHCRRFRDCLLTDALKNFNLFLRYMCLLRRTFVGICCPDNPVIEITDKEENATDSAIEIIQPPEGCGLNTKTRIVGGKISVPHEWTWMVALMKNNRFYCGGVIINNWYILTAAHCVFGVNIRDVKVRLGEHNFNSKTEHQSDISIAEIKRHAQFVTLTFQHDIALLKLKHMIEYTKFVGSICLPNQASRDYSDVNGTVVGWGTVSFGGAASPILREVTIPVWRNEKCDKTYLRENIGNSFMCAGSPENGEDACQGDSGGPLMAVNERGRWEIIGIVSWGRRCGDPTYPGVYTRVTTYLDWIRENAV